MKLATLRNNTPDGSLIIVSSDMRRAISAADIAPTLQGALDQWTEIEPKLRARAEALSTDAVPAFAFNPLECMAPLPRAYQWCDGSAYLQHGYLMEQALKHPPRENFETIPLLYQGGSDDLLAAHEDVRLPDEAHGIDFEGEFVVVTNHVPMGCDPESAIDHVVLIGQVNDWSLRNLIPREYNSGFGFFQGKPATSFAPVLITPDELGSAWRDARVHLDLWIEWNGKLFGYPNGGEMHFHFGQLIAHAAQTRRLGPGTIVGSGTISNTNPDVGSACISERRVIEVMEQGSPATEFMKFGDRVRMEARDRQGNAPFGAIDQCVAPADRALSASQG